MTAGGAVGAVVLYKGQSVLSYLVSFTYIMDKVKSGHNIFAARTAVVLANL